VPINPRRFESWACRAYRGVNASRRVIWFERWALRELQRVGLPPVLPPNKYRGIEFSLKRERRILGGYGRKNIDVVLETDTSGPLLAVSLKAETTSIHKNLGSRWEEAVGEAANVHTRFPMLVFGHLRILPFLDTASNHLYIDNNGQPTDYALEYASRFRSLAGRTGQTDPVGEYEEVAVAFVDHQANRPMLHRHFPDGEIRLEAFFDRLVAKLIQRNPFLSEGLL
jgi:hypothetical protein